MTYTEDQLVPELAKETKAPTEADWKRFNKNYVTRVLPITNLCHHKLDPDLPPKTNCETCWLSYFNNYGEQVYEVLKQLETSEGEQALLQANGTKYVRNFKRFVAAVKALEENGKE